MSPPELSSRSKIDVGDWTYIYGDEHSDADFSVSQQCRDRDESDYLARPFVTRGTSLFRTSARAKRIPGWLRVSHFLEALEELIRATAESVSRERFFWDFGDFCDPMVSTTGAAACLCAREGRRRDI